MRILEKPTSHRQSEFLAAVRKSRRLHGAWVAAPRTPKAFKAYLRRIRNKVHLGYWVVTKDGELAGVINVNEIVRGAFCSGYLGYYAFVPHNGKGYLTRGLAAVLTDLFRVHGLHRVEANIQPGNKDSQVLVQRLGFRLEGFSPRYLRIAGRWRDHERWALTVEDWRRRPARPDNNGPLKSAAAQPQAVRHPMISDDEIDETLLANVIYRWRKVARVVGSAMSQLGDKRRGRDDLYFAQRLSSLVQRGLIEADGDLNQLGRCKARLAGGKDDA